MKEKEENDGVPNDDSSGSGKEENDGVPNEDSSGSGKEEITDEVTVQSKRPVRGEDLARVLLDELSSDRLPEPKPRDKERWTQVLEATIPKRGGAVGFQIVDGQDAGKSVFSLDIASEPNDEDYKRLFCMTHSEFVPSGCVASDHVYPYAKIQKNQDRLLKFLNAKENSEITNSFLAYLNIDEYFRRDEDDTVKGTTYFYRKCYNILGNLVLMCQGCNSEKSDLDPYDWYTKEIKEENNYFGRPFREHVENLGGLQEGILLPRVYEANDSYDRVPLSKETSIMLPPTSIRPKKFGTEYFPNLK